MRHRCQDVSKNEVKYCGKTPVEIAFKKKLQEMQKNFNYYRKDITSTLGLNWLKKFSLTVRNIQLYEKGQSETKATN